MPKQGLSLKFGGINNWVFLSFFQAFPKYVYVSTCMGAYVSVCLRLPMYVNVSEHICMCASMCTSVHVMHVSMFACVHDCVYLYAHLCTCLSACVPMCECMFAHVCPYMYVCLCTGACMSLSVSVCECI